MFSSFQNLFHHAVKYIAEVRAVMNVGDYLDIAFIAILISIAFVWLRRRAGRTIVIVLFGILLIYSTARQLKMPMTSALFQFGLMAVFMSIVIIFQDDFRRTFESITTWRPWGAGGGTSGGKLADLLMECLQTLSNQKTGALIALQGRQSIEPHSRAGIPLYGKPSVPLLLSIFDPNSPGHDGGLVMVEGRIQFFGAHFPLSRDAQTTGRLGTRHAAALGLAEKCDALVLVVSEETGTISTAHDGKFRSPNSTEIRKQIVSFLKRSNTAHVSRTMWEIPWLRLTASCPVAIFLWFAYARPVNLIVRTMDATIVYRNLPKGWEAKAPDPGKVQLTLFGPEGPLMQMDSSNLSIPVDLTKLKAGESLFILGEAGISLPPRVVIKRIEPSDIIVQAYQTIDVKLPVRLTSLNGRIRLPSSKTIRVEPPHVQIRLPKLAFQPAFLETDTIDWPSLIRNGRQKVKLRIPTEAPSAELNPKEVDVIYSEK